ncbi:hypothetical protein [Haloarcula laminariae]|uniref:hypothetical protein n=1 Tax=Haloarcula laminariae TaxID=2961577 RepID=UPI0024075440|nr:hypothetical protein [Halomicroarcula sp. FL173]
MLSKIPNSGEFLDDHEEQHAVPTGAAIGFAVVATGQLQQLGLVLVILLEAIERGRDRPAPAEGQDLANDVRREPHYFAAGLVIGAVIGIGARVVT